MTEETCTSPAVEEACDPEPEEALNLLIVGAGPAGLATAIAATRAGLPHEVIEKGALVNSLYNYPTNLVFFTTPELMEIGGMPFTTPYFKPTRMEALRYYRRVADSFGLRVSFNEEACRIEREGPFLVITTRTSDGSLRVRRSRFVVLATGYYDNPNKLGVPGENLPHVSHYYSDSHPYFRKQVVIVGAANSAAVAALELFRGGATVTLVHRGAQLDDAIKYWLRPDLENRIKEGSIAALFNTRVLEIHRSTVRVSSAAGSQEIPADAVFLMTGYHPNSALLRCAGVAIDEATGAPVHDPETLETNVQGLFLAGAVTSGNNTNMVFIENGRFHGERVIKTIYERLKRRS